MLDRVAAATIEVARAAIAAPRFSDRLRDLGKVRRLDDLSAPWRHLAGFIERVPGVGRHLLVSPGGVVACQTIHIFLVREVEVLVGPTVSSMATGTARFVGDR